MSILTSEEEESIRAYAHDALDCEVREDTVNLINDLERIAEILSINGNPEGIVKMCNLAAEGYVAGFAEARDHLHYIFVQLTTNSYKT
ncbi:MAG: hypothetical protein KKH52_03905 [Nanoarchaeota archaeon]|nr:hypothetical protein [Nanoarchaeota archaeon]MBU1622214.1 hypothetical protein [Nanoarchaeota archaeon]MBU1974513.1 hypothetical protein [Nanoarchaeota archaeon]